MVVRVKTAMAMAVVVIAAPVSALELVTRNTDFLVCDREFKDTISVGNEGLSQYIHNDVRTSVPKAISNFESMVEIYSDDESVLTGCLSSEDWKIASNYSPGGDEWVVAYGANCTFNAPDEGSSSVVRFRYKTTFFEFVGEADALNALGDHEFTHYLGYEAIRDEEPITTAIENVFLGTPSTDENVCVTYEVIAQ